MRTNEKTSSINTVVVKSINGVEILASKVSEGLVPVKPICEMLEIDYPTQFQKLKEHPIYSSSIGLRTMVAADGKNRDMVCIPFDFFTGWLFSINPANVKEEAKENLIRFQLECNKVLYDHFFGTYKRANEQIREENELLRKLADYNQQRNELNKSISMTKKQLEKLQKKRLKEDAVQTSFFPAI